MSTGGLIKERQEEKAKEGNVTTFVFSRGILVNYRRCRAIGLNSPLETIKGINTVTSGL